MLPLPERFWSKVDKSGECWVWTAGRVPFGYGVFWIDGKHCKAHRLVWAEANGPIPDGRQICHHCDNPPCVRLDHLFAGTPADNVHDMRTKGRHYTPREWGTPYRVGETPDERGELNPVAKLTDANVIELRRLRAEGVRLRVLAARYGVSTATVSLAARGLIWGHLPL